MADVRPIDAKSYEDVLYCKINRVQLAAGIQSALAMLRKEPTIDAVPVVRCKECKFRALDNGYFLCNRKMVGMVRPDSFCSFGEREDDGLH